MVRGGVVGLGSKLNSVHLISRARTGPAVRIIDVDRSRASNLA
jgi:hypothetical protein